MRKHRYGFTLIELLAVIVILAIIALIVTPIVSEIINSSKIAANKRSAENYVRAAENYYAEMMMSNENLYDTNIIDRLELSGNKATRGEVKVNQDGEVSIAIVIGNICYMKSYSGTIADITTSDDIENCGSDIEPTIAVGQTWKYDYKDSNSNGIKFNYTGNVQEFVATKAGKYKLEVWGAQGGGSSSNPGGYGGYATGVIELAKNQKVYITIGGQGKVTSSAANQTAPGGYNGGGSGLNSSMSDRYAGGGGGATHISTELVGDGLLKDYVDSKDKIIIVAGGGAGFWDYSSSFQSRQNGSGGGNIGGTGTSTNSSVDGATQTTGYAFGEGESITEGEKAGAGGGYYGGYACTSFCASGGSGYIGYNNLLNAKMVCYNCTEDKEHESTYTESNTCASGNAKSECSKKGNGYAIITYLDDEIDNTQIQRFVVPKTGTYKLEVWGAQGGNAPSDGTGGIGGLGGYSTGDVNLEKNQIIYIVVGGQGTVEEGDGLSGGFNGGGTGGMGSPGYENGSGGGGATHIALNNNLGELKNYVDNKNDILLVAGGGGGGCAIGTDSGGNGGLGGGTSGGIAKTYKNFTINSGTQSSGYAFGEGQSVNVTKSFAGAGAEGNGGGGGGYYGGYASTATGVDSDSGGAGGSGYLSNTLFNSASTAGVRTGNGYAKITFVKDKSNQSNTCNYDVGTSWPFDYLDENNEVRYHTFSVPCKGNYKIEVWGAQGGDTGDYHGGYGGYATGTANLSTSDELYIVIGGAGIGTTLTNQNLSGGFNGGGSVSSSNVNHVYGSGGGATHVALNTNLGELKYYIESKENILIVAGGGGGARDQSNHVAAARWAHGGSGGGYKSGYIYSNNGTMSLEKVTGNISTQDSGYAFGEGESVTSSGAGGGGYFGGASGGNSYYYGAGAGGSGYIKNSLSNKQMACYDCEENIEYFTKNVTCSEENFQDECSKKGNGYAKITYLGE